jgi:hypothetical protein
MTTLWANKNTLKPKILIYQRLGFQDSEKIK